MRFSRHSGIFRSDGFRVAHKPGAGTPPPVGRRPRPGKRRDGRSASCSSSAMSSGRLFLDRDARQQSPSPLPRQLQRKALAGAIGTNYHRTVPCVLTACLIPGGHPTLCLNCLSHPRGPPHLALPSFSNCLVRGVLAGCYQPLLPAGSSRRYLCESFPRCLIPCHGGPTRCTHLFLPSCHRPSPSIKLGRLPAISRQNDFPADRVFEAADIP